MIAPSENDNGTLSKLYASGERHAIVVTYKVKHFSWWSKCFITVGGDKSAWKNEIANPIVDFVLSRRVERKSRSNIANITFRFNNDDTLLFIRKLCDVVLVTQRWLSKHRKAQNIFFPCNTTHVPAVTFWFLLTSFIETRHLSFRLLHMKWPISRLPHLIRYLTTKITIE